MTELKETKACIDIHYDLTCSECGEDLYSQFWECPNVSIICAEFNGQKIHSDAQYWESEKKELLEANKQ